MPHKKIKKYKHQSRTKQTESIEPKTTGMEKEVKIDAASTKGSAPLKKKHQQTKQFATETLVETSESPKVDLPSLLFKAGIVIIVIGILSGIMVFRSVLFEEFKYLFLGEKRNSEVVVEPVSEEKKNVIVAADSEFSIVVPKIGANAPVVANVDPFNSFKYQAALAKGVAHAEGTVYPGQIGNVFLFAHSSENFYEATRFNSVFYLLNKLNKDDDFYLVHKGEIYKYKVTEAKVVDSDKIEYIKGTGDRKTATLMTCWPAGTTLKRLVVVGEISER